MFGRGTSVRCTIPFKSYQLITLHRRTIPRQWFPIHYWATDTLRNIVARRPELARVLLKYDLDSPIAFVLSPSPSPNNSGFTSNSQPSTPLRQGSFVTEFSSTASQSNYHSSQPRRSSTVSSSDSSSAKSSVRGRLDAYLDEATKRAEELSASVKEWTKYTPDALPKIQPVDTSAWHATLLVGAYPDLDTMDEPE